MNAGVHVAVAPTPIRVLFVINSLRTGGAEKQVLTLLQTLDTERFTLGLVYLRDQEELMQQVPVDRLAFLACSNAARYVDIGGIRRLAEQLDTFKPDVVVCTNSWSLLNVSLARPLSRSGFRLIEVFHTTTLGTLKQKVQMRLHYPLFARSDLLVYVCNTQREFWRRRGMKARRDAVVYNGIDPRRFDDVWSVQEKQAQRRALGFAADDYVIGLCAVFRPEKAHVDLLAAVAELRERSVPAKALLIGDGDRRAEIEAEIQRLGLADHVRITGYVNDVRPYVSVCDVMTLVSHAIETFSIAALESLAMGKPMVMSRIGGAEELVRDGENGRLYAAGDIDALCRHLGELADPEVRQRYSVAAQRSVRERFTTERMTRDFASCLTAVVTDTNAECRKTGARPDHSPRPHDDGIATHR